MDKTYPKNKPRGYVFGAKWGGVLCKARACLVVVGIAPTGWWCVGMTGETRSAIEVHMDEKIVFIDNEKGHALNTFLRGLAPLPGFRFLPAFQVLDDPKSEIFYKAKFE